MSAERDPVPQDADNAFVEKDEIVQVVPDHAAWGRCIAVVYEVKPWGIRARIGGSIVDPRGNTYINLTPGEFVRTGGRLVFTERPGG